MRRRLRDLGALFLVVGFLFGDACSLGAPSPSTSPAANIQTAIAGYLKDLANDDGFSGAVLVAKDYVPFASVVNGLGDRQRAWYISTQTNLNIASVTKLLTAVAIGQLVDQGKVSLDDPLAKFLPSYPKANG